MYLMTDINERIFVLSDIIIKNVFDNKYFERLTDLGGASPKYWSAIGLKYLILNLSLLQSLISRALRAKFQFSAVNVTIKPVVFHMLSTLAVISTGEHRPSRFVISENNFYQGFKFEIWPRLFDVDELKIKIKIYFLFFLKFSEICSIPSVKYRKWPGNNRSSKFKF